MATHFFACSWATTLVDVSSASHRTPTKSTFSVKGISECPVFLQFYLLPTSVIFVKLQNGDLFFSCGFIHFHEMHSNCGHILLTLPLPHHLLALTSVTLNVFKQHIYHALLCNWLLAAYNMWDIPQVPCPFITISDTILFTIPATCCCALYCNAWQVTMLSFTFVLLFILTFLPSCASNSISELEVVLTSVASGQ